jgi:uncharacterized protein (DUF697 family)
MTERETKTDKAKGIVRNYMLGALAVGLIPLPLVDLMALSGIQLKMLHSLARLYGIEFSEQLGKSVIASLLGGGVSLSLSSNLASLVKSIPFYGLTRMVSVSLFGGASTYAIGQVFIQHFESGGTFLNFDPHQVRDYYAKQFKEGKEEVKKSFVGIKP